MSAASHPTVAIVIPCYRQGRFLAGAIKSALNQSVPADDIVVVDDGGEEDLAPIVGRFPMVRLVRQANRGLASARNFGLRQVACDKVIFLDADDRLLPEAVAAGLDCFADHPGAAFVYGAYEELTHKGRTRFFHGAASRADLVRFNCVGMIASAMFDRKRLMEQGGFDESLGMCEDWDAFLRLSRGHFFQSHSDDVAIYSKHDANMSNDVAELRYWLAEVRERERQRGLSRPELRAWREGEHVLEKYYGPSRQRALWERVYRKAWRVLARV